MADHSAPLHRVVDGGPGPVPARPVVLVHGFTQTLAAWGPVAQRLAGRWQVVRVDLPGHGGSGGVRVGFAEAAGLVGELRAIHAQSPTFERTNWVLIIATGITGTPDCRTSRATPVLPL